MIGFAKRNYSALFVIVLPQQAVPENLTENRLLAEHLLWVMR